MVGRQACHELRYRPKVGGGAVGTPVQMFAARLLLGPEGVVSFWPGVDRREAPGTILHMPRPRRGRQQGLILQKLLSPRRGSVIAIQHSGRLPSVDPRPKACDPSRAEEPRDAPRTPLSQVTPIWPCPTNSGMMMQFVDQESHISFLLRISQRPHGSWLSGSE